MLLHQTLGRHRACGTLLSSLISEGLTCCPVNPRLIELLKKERKKSLLFPVPKLLASGDVMRETTYCQGKKGIND